MELDVSKNKLSGEIPSTLSRCLEMERLILHVNLLQGRILESLKALAGLQEMDVSHNNLSGDSRISRKALILKRLNLSFNNFVCEVPTKGIFANKTTISVSDRVNF